MGWRRSAGKLGVYWVQVPEIQIQIVPGGGEEDFGPAGQVSYQLEQKEDVNPLVSG